MSEGWFVGFTDTDDTGLPNRTGEDTSVRDRLLESMVLQEGTDNMIQSKHAVYGTAILRNGVPIAWLQFESGKLTHKEAEQAALQTARATLPADVMWANPIRPEICRALRAKTLIYRRIESCVRRCFA